MSGCWLQKADMIDQRIVYYFEMMQYLQIKMVSILSCPWKVSCTDNCLWNNMKDTRKKYDINQTDFQDMYFVCICMSQEENNTT